MRCASIFTVTSTRIIFLYTIVIVLASPTVVDVVCQKNWEREGVQVAVAIANKGVPVAIANKIVAHMSLTHKVDFWYASVVIVVVDEVFALQSRVDHTVS